MLAATAGQVQGGFVAYSNRTAFNAATSGGTLIDFESYAEPSNGVNYLGGSVTIGDVTFSQAGNRLFVLSPNVYSTNGSAYLNHNNDSAEDIQVSFANAVYSVGFDIGFVANWGSDATPGLFSLLLSNGDLVSGVRSPVHWYSSVHTGEQLSFIGFVSDTAISGFTIQDLTDGTVVDDFVFGSAAAVPEPASLAMWGLGAVGLMFASRKRRRMLMEV